MQNSNFQIPTTFLQNSIARQERLRKQQLERKESPQPAKTPSKDSTLDQIKQLEEKRNQRRQRDLIIKQNQQGINQSQRDSISFSKLLLKVKEKYLQIPSKSLLQPSSKGITVCIRKRPLPNPSDSNFDIVSCSNSNVFIHEPKVKLNGDLNIDTHKFLFDCVFDESSSNSDVYTCIVKDLVDKMFKGGKVLLFAYGQTGSGKTHTIFGQDDNPGILFSACLDIIQIYNDTLSNPSIILKVRFYEIYGTKVYDLLNQRQRVELLEDGRGNTQIVGLKEININTFDEFKLLVEFGCRERTVGSTEANPTSSRSHAVLQIMLVDQEISQTTPSLSNSYRAKSVLLDNIKGQFTFVDLAGSERGVETGNISRQARQEGSEINKSLLALKECIRALYRESSLTNISNNSFDEFTSSFSSSFDSHIHIPFRGSILTRILRDSFTEKTSRTVMFATIGPGSSSVEHSLNTLRYADRVKELKSRNGDKSEKKSDDEEFQNDDAIVDEIVTSDRDSENSSEIQFKGDEEIVDDGNDGLVDLHAKTVERMKVILQDEQKLIEDFVNGDIELNEYTLLVEGLMMQRIDETMIVYNSLKR